MRNLREPLLRPLQCPACIRSSEISISKERELLPGTKHCSISTNSFTPDSPFFHKRRVSTATYLRATPKIHVRWVERWPRLGRDRTRYFGCDDALIWSGNRSSLRTLIRRCGYEEMPRAKLQTAVSIELWRNNLQTQLNEEIVQCQI